MFSSAVIAMAKHGLAPAEKGNRLWATLSQDPRGCEWSRVVERLTVASVSVVVVDLPDKRTPVRCQTSSKEVDTTVVFYPFEPAIWAVSRLGGDV